MDQKKFISFLILSVSVLMLFNIMFPPPQKPKPVAPVAAKDADAGKGADAGKNADTADVAKDEDDDEAEVKDEEHPPAEDGNAIQPAEVAEAKTEDQFVTLGSLDMTSGHRMLVMLTNAGAAVKRAEMASPRFADQHDWSGYLGELELKNADGGVRVRVVGAGTPAANAEPTAIEPGDVIVGIDVPKPPQTLTVESFKKALHGTKPGDELTLQVRRGQNAPESRMVRLVRRPLAVLRPEIENYEMRDAEPPPGFVDPPSFVVSLPQLDDKPLKGALKKRLSQVMENGNWEIADHNETSVTFRRQLPDLNLEITKQFTLAAVPPDSRNEPNYPGYHLDLAVELRNTAEQARTLTYRLDGPTGMPLEGWWYAHKISQRWFSAAGLRDVVVRFAGSPEAQIDCPQITQGKVEPMGQGQALAYAGVDGQYFSAVLIPQKPLADVWFDTTEAIVVGPQPPPRTPLTYTNVTCRLTRTPIELAASGTHRDTFQVFIGPKRPALLDRYQAGGDPNYSLRDVNYYGLALFGTVARLMLVLLHFFHKLVGNYGIAIIMLTVMVRGLMFPISYRQTKNMARMQSLKPEMDRITAMYKTDMQKRSQAMQELYRKHEINPLGGCLPMFLQLPVFIGLYRALMVDIELRQSPLFGHGIRWCSNLAAPDMLLDWSPIMPDFIDHGLGLFGLGPYLNVFPIIAVTLMLVSTKLTMPPPANEQAEMQQKMMKYMMVFMGLLFYKVASGLCLYFIASSLWGIAERKLLPKAQAAAAGGEAAGSANGGGKRPRDGGPRTDGNGRPARKKGPTKAPRKK